MIRKTSDYRHSYRGSDVNKLRQSWEKNSSYRDLRRQSEHCHTPLGWQDDEEWVDLEDAVSEPSTGRRPSSVPIHKYKHDKFNKAYQERMRRLVEAKLDKMTLNDDGYGSGNPSPSPDFAQEEKARNIQSKRDEQKRNKKSPVELASSGEFKLKADVKSSEKMEGSKKTFKLDLHKNDKSPKETVARPRKPTHKKPLPRPRPSSAPSRRDKMISHIQPPIKHMIEPDFIGEPSPFVTYGSKDEELITGTKKTHNIRASAGIYPSAIRANRRRQMLMEEAEEKLRSASHREKQKRALFSHLFRRDKSEWETEYQRSYVEYDGGLYKRNLAQRFDPKLAYEAYTVP